MPLIETDAQPEVEVRAFPHRILVNLIQRVGGGEIQSREVQKTAMPVFSARRDTLDRETSGEITSQAQARWRDIQSDCKSGISRHAQAQTKGDEVFVRFWRIGR